MKTYGYRKTCACLSIPALFLVPKTWKQPQWPSADERINKTWYMHVMKYHLAIQRNEARVHATTCMNIENIVSERSQSQETTHCHMTLFM